MGRFQVASQMTQIGFVDGGQVARKERERCRRVVFFTGKGKTGLGPGRSNGGNIQSSVLCV